MKQWTKEEIERLVPEGFIRLTQYGMQRDSSLDIAHALLQTRLDLEESRESTMALGASALSVSKTKDETIIRLRGALERIANKRAGGVMGGPIGTTEDPNGYNWDRNDAIMIAREALEEKP